MGMRRLFIIRKDLHLTPGKLAAMVAHCAEGYWISLIKQNITLENGEPNVSFSLDKEIYADYLNGRITKTICEAKNMNQLSKARDMALELGLIENQDFGMINDACLTELTPEWTDENGQGRCTVGIWFKPLNDEVAHTISKKFQLYKG